MVKVSALAFVGIIIMGMGGVLNGLRMFNGLQVSPMIPAFIVWSGFGIFVGSLVVIAVLTITKEKSECHR